MAKFLDIAEFYSSHGGGVRTYVHQKLAAAAAAGHTCVVIAPGDADRVEQRRGGRIVWVRSRPHPMDHRYYTLRNRAAVHEVLDQEQPDVVEGSSPWSGGRFAAGWRGPAIKSLFIHQDPVAAYGHTLFGRWLDAGTIDRLSAAFWHYLRRLSRQFDTAIVAGEWMARRLASFGVERLTAIPFGADRAAFSPGARDPALRVEMLRLCGIEAPDARLLIAIGRHHPEKRWETMISGVRLARRSANIGLFGVGDGPWRAWVARCARRAGHVHLAGATADRALLARWLASADGFLHGSAAETYGIVVAEALASGLPLVVPNVGGAAELARPGYAETYPPGDVRACAEAILRLLARERTSTSAAASAAAQRLGDPADHFKHLFAHYQGLIDRRRLACSAPAAVAAS
ncbi:MAG: glycosyltransferase [Rhodospirillaceae bacterium]|nr:glycosyltransferase [Rhodospirillaceae bacterium]